MASKYHNRKTIVDTIQFDSRKEAHQYQELVWMQQAGLICHHELQPRYDLIINGHPVGFYKVDFRYQEVATRTIITEDVKSEATRTAVYLLKKKLVRALYGTQIIEV